MSVHTLRGTIGAVANAAAVSVETIRSYQRRRLLAAPPRRRGEVRHHGPAAVARVRFIKTAQGLGFSLVEIAGLLALDDGAHCDEARAVAEGRLNDVRAKLRDLRRLEGALAAVVADCGVTRDTMTRPLMASLHASKARIARRTASTTTGPRATRR